jgi:ligand-binding sensor domain-containing protein
MAWQGGMYLWLSGNDGLVRWNTQTAEAEAFKNISGKLFVDSNNKLWVFDTDTISLFDGKSWEHFESGKDFSDGGILSFIETNGYVWVGTFGVSRYNQQNKSWELLFQIAPGPTPTPIPQNVPVVEALSKGIHSMTSANGGGMWFGSDRGLAYWENDIQETWGNDILNTQGVRCLLGISANEVWVCTEQGFGRWNGVQLVDFIEDYGENKQLIRGEGQEIWATGEEGVSRWDGVSWNNWVDTQEPDLSANDSLRKAFSLIVSMADSNIWVVSTQGIARWNGQEWRTYTSEDGLTADFTYVLIQDSKGIPWAGTNNGIYRYNPDTDRWQPFP